MRRPFLRCLNLVISIILIHAQQSQAKIYLELEKQPKQPWQTCYTENVTAAVNDLTYKRFLGGNDAEIKNLKVNKNILQFELYYFGEKYRNVEMKPCPFSDEDLIKTANCDLTVQDRGANKVNAPAPLKNLGSFLPKIAQLWHQQGYQEKVIDCNNNQTLVIRNRWMQPMSIANIKVLSLIANKYQKPLIFPAMGTISSQPSLMPFQSWSAVIQFDVMENLQSAEVLDASIVQFSVPEEVTEWIALNQGAWTPWGLQIVSLKCEGFDLISDPNALERIPLDPQSPSIKNYCSNQPY